MSIIFIYLSQLFHSITKKMSTPDLSLFKKFNQEEYYLESDLDESSGPLLPVEEKKKEAAKKNNEDEDSDDEDVIYAAFCKRYIKGNQLYKYLQSADYNTEVGKEEVGKKLAIPESLTESTQELLTENEMKRVATNGKFHPIFYKCNEKPCRMCKRQPCITVTNAVSICRVFENINALFPNHPNNEKRKKAFQSLAFTFNHHLYRKAHFPCVVLAI